MTTLTRRSFHTTVGLALLGTVFRPSLGHAEILPAVETQNQAQLQRTRSQRMARAPIFMKLGVEKSRHMEMLQTAADEFRTVLAALRNGSPDGTLLAQTEPRVLEAIDTVEQIWGLMAPSVDEILASGEVTDTALSPIIDNNAVLLFTSNNVVEQMLSFVARADGGAARYAAAINVAGLQRTTAQQLAKEVGKIALDISPEASRGSLREQVLLFDQSLDAITEGVPELGIIAPPRDVALRITNVRSLWSGFRSKMTDVANGAKADLGLVFTIASQADTLTSGMNDVVLAYEELASAGA